VIQVAISYGTGANNRYDLESIPKNIQLAMYKYELYKQNERQLIEALEKEKINVLTTHLPLNTLTLDANDVVFMIHEISQKFDCPYFIIHPNRKIESFISYYLDNRIWNDEHDYKLCIETFGWKSKKRIRTPIDIMEYCVKYPELSMCIDTSHVEEMWLDHKILSSLLRHTSVIHLSNRAKGHGSHLPFNSPNGELNLVRFVIDLKKVYNWSGVIVLEYMPEYQHKLMKNYQYIKRLLGEDI